MSDTLAAALAAFQAEIPIVGKGAAAIIQGEKDGRKYTYGYKYADLGAMTAVVLPLLGKHGLSFTSRPTVNDRGFVLQYSLRHASGESDDGEWPLPDPLRTDPKKVGSAITYARRYALSAATGVATGDEDDDGEAAGTPDRDGQAIIDAARRTRNQPPEVDADGAATVAEQTRMITGPEPGAQRSRSTPADSEFYGDPFKGLPNPDDVPKEERHGTATVQQIRDINIRLGALTRDAKLKRLSAELGVTVHSSKDLSMVQAATLLRVLPLVVPGPEAASAPAVQAAHAAGPGTPKGAPVT